MKYISFMVVFLTCLTLTTFGTSVSTEESNVPEATTVSESVQATEESTSERESTSTEEPVSEREITSEEKITSEGTTQEKEIESTTEPTTEPETEPKKRSDDYDVNANVSGKYHSLKLFRRDGEYYDASGYTFTWYSEKVLPGPGLKIPGRHVNDEGYVCDEDGNICLASTTLSKGTVVKIPFGNGIGVVYDECVASGRILDVYIH